MKLVLQIYEENLDNKLGILLLVHCQNLLLERHRRLKLEKGVQRTSITKEKLKLDCSIFRVILYFVVARKNLN
jgi:hypothetical protein